MAIRRVGKVIQQGDHQVIELPQGVHFDSSEVIVTQQVENGEATLDPLPRQQTDESLREMFAEIDALGITDDQWDEYAAIMKRIVDERHRDIPEPGGAFDDELEQR